MKTNIGKFEIWDTLRKLQKRVAFHRAVSVFSSGVFFLLVCFLRVAVEAAGKDKGIPVLFAGIAIAFFALLGMKVSYSKYKRYYAFLKEAYKECVFDWAADGLFDTYVYYPKSGYDREFIRDTGMILMAKGFESEDLVEGAYKGVSFRRADVRVFSEKSNERHFNTKGTWYVFAFPEPVVSEMLIVSRKFAHADTEARFQRSTDLRHPFETGDIPFDRLFECTCQDDAEAFSVLTPEFRRKLMELKEKLGCPILLGFRKNMLHVVIQTGENRLDPPVFGDMKLDAELEKTRDELRTICEITDALGMDRTGAETDGIHLRRQN